MKESRVIGTKIQSIREAKQLSVEDVCKRSGFTREQIERIENNEDFPSLAPLVKIARTLGVRLGTFLDDESGREPVICRKNDPDDIKSVYFNNQTSAGCSHMEYRLLAESKADRHMEPFLIEVAPQNEENHSKFSSHEGEEFIYVLEGKVEIRYGKDTYFLEERDSMYYDSVVAHCVHSVAGTKAKILAIAYNAY